jgi:hypothetical protein
VALEFRICGPFNLWPFNSESVALSILSKIKRGGMRKESVALSILSKNLRPFQSFPTKKPSVALQFRICGPFNPFYPNQKTLKEDMSYKKLKKNTGKRVTHMSKYE